MRRGDLTRRIPRGYDSVWLDDGRLLVDIGYTKGKRRDARRPYVYDPATARSTLFGTESTLPDQALWGIVIGGAEGSTELRSPDLTRTTTLTVPPFDPPSPEASRDVGDPVVLNGVTYLSYSVYDEEKKYGYGYFRVPSDRKGAKATTVLQGKRIIALWASDDPATGRIAKTYGVPDGYDKTWRVERIDKSGDAVAVQHVRRQVSPADPIEIGTFRYADGRWSKVGGSSRVLTWWQARDERIEARLSGRTVAHARLYWVHGSKETRVPGDLSVDGSFGTPSIPGALLRPVR